MKLQVEIQFREHCTEVGICRIKFYRRLDFVLRQSASLFPGRKCPAIIGAISSFVWRQPRRGGEMADSCVDPTLLQGAKTFPKTVFGVAKLFFGGTHFRLRISTRTINRLDLTRLWSRLCESFGPFFGLVEI